LRFESPVAAIPRVAREALSVRGVEIPAGALVQLVLSSANRDESVFPNPDTFDIRRHGGALMSFGTGPHTCLGAMLAREETEIALALLLERFPEISMDPELPVIWYRNLGNRGPVHLPLRLHC
jgi:cytochrome P450